jgi:hypothetical protein
MDEDLKECDIAFFECVLDDACGSCFFDMTTHSIDWAGVTQDTDCSTVVSTLQKKNFCTSLTTTNQATFCKTFHSCVVFDTSASSGKNRTIDCDTLDKCDWPGIHPSFIGDGVCHDSYFDSCYNTAICNFDGGDCCKDTCTTKKGAYLECGSDGYSCRDPASKECNPTLSLKCPPSSYKKTADDTDLPIPNCKPNEALYRIVMLDSFGDGWEQTEMTITPQSSTTIVFKGGLKSGSEGTVYACLSADPQCYHVLVTGGNWGREASWYLRGFSEGAPAIASGGGAMDCTFPVSGATCANTCTGNSNVDPSKDPNYKDFKSMTKCIDDKCMIQISECQNDLQCQKCFVESVPDYCFSIKSFLAVNDCAMCKCTIDDANQEGMKEYCDSKQAPGMVIPKPNNAIDPAQPVQCTPAETLSGTTALLQFSKCLDFDKNPLLMTDFDSNNFGHIDTFESCAHTFAASVTHGGETALGCMQILVDAINEDVKDGQPTKLISQLANHLYSDGLNFCDCAKTASNDAPLCPSFYNFKTLLYESLDACKALDEIDCNAWDEFQYPCQINLKAKFGSVDFTRTDQCDYIKGKCGGAGPFPSFRRLDCERDIPKPSWQVYIDYKSGCLDKTQPVRQPTTSPISPVTQPTPYEPIKPDNIKPNGGVAPTPSNNGKPTKPSYRSPDEKKKSHWFRNTIMIAMALGIVYYCYTRRSGDGLNFVRYRRMTNFQSNPRGGGVFGMDDNDLFSGLSLESSTNFEPPTLPPTPMYMPSNTGGYGA